MKRLSYILLLHTLIFSSIFTRAADTLKTAYITRITTPPKIDCEIDEVWNQALPISDFEQYFPIYNAPCTKHTEVRLLYDDKAIYVLAQLQDPSPDSILHQLANRDDDNINADFFSIQFDTYNNKLDAYDFTVYASGVQADSRFEDYTYNAVWESKTKITQTGWMAEIKIPYAALRFPNTDIQTWGMQIQRYIRRNRERNYWCQMIKGTSNSIIYWGKLQGLKNINAPVRLSFNPYLSGGLETNSYSNFKDASTSRILAGGLDLKYGLNESFTLDMTLLPDFSQVQSDNKVKNLTAFETVYDEQRPFFNEATDLFSKGDLFYSRRIGRTPRNFYDVENILDSGETIKKNPSQAHLINATKFSGRNKNGLAIGCLNAITGDTWAVIQKPDGGIRKILTEPFTNYNILVFDQALKNNSHFYVSNSNVQHRDNFQNADATAGGFSIYDKSNTWNVTGNGSTTNFYLNQKSESETEKDKSGKSYSVKFQKVKGNLHFSLYNSFMDKYYNANDAGLTLYRNYMIFSGNLSYNVYEPWWVFREIYNTLSVTKSYNYSTWDASEQGVYYNVWGTLKNYLSIWANAKINYGSCYDYYEPRIDGRYFITRNTPGFSVGFSSDYRKPFALDGYFSYYKTEGYHDTYHNYNLSPIIRLSDHFTFTYSFSYSDQLDEKGFATLSTNQDSIIFGKRNVETIVNTFKSTYIIKNDLSLSLRLRHYWSYGIYQKYYLLTENGLLGDLPEGTNYHQDFNFNTFNLDFIFSWQFAPGSNLSFIWKKQILNESDAVVRNYTRNIEDTFDQLQTNSFSVKAIYYLDYQYFIRKKS